MRVCAMDIGTNSTRYMVADLDSQSSRVTVLFQGGKITRLGGDIGKGKIAPEHFAKTLDAVDQFFTHALSLAVSDFKILGTAALREATNGADFCQEVQSRTGFPLTIITGEKEAALTELAIANSLHLQDKPFVGFDIGGGSAQIICHDPGKSSRYESLPLGALRLSQQFLTDDPPRVDQMQALQNHAQLLIRDALQKIVPSPGCVLVGVGGTATTASAMIQKLRVYDHAKIHGSTIRQDNWDKLVASLAALSSAQRMNQTGLQKGREDIIVAGLAVMSILAQQCDAKEILVSDRGVLYGTLAEYLHEMKS